MRHRSSCLQLNQVGTHTFIKMKYRASRRSIQTSVLGIAPKLQMDCKETRRHFSPKLALCIHQTIEVTGKALDDGSPEAFCTMSLKRYPGVGVLSLLVAR